MPDEALFTREEAHALMLKERDVYPEDACPACRGYGVKSYASTATWRGGMGGSAMTLGQCDRCWGSGDAARPWQDMRTHEAETLQRIATTSLTHLADYAGCDMRAMHPAVRELIKELQAFDRQRRTRPAWFQNMCHGLIKVLERGLEDYK